MVAAAKASYIFVFVYWRTVLQGIGRPNLPAETGGKPETTKVKEMWASGIFPWNSP
jgi:hypothetical protein